MEIVIPAQQDNSILKPITIELGNYTVFAGENNTGKTNLIKGMLSKIGEKNTIYIPAEQIDAASQVKTGAKDDPMKDAISKLLDVVLSEVPVIGGTFRDLFSNIQGAFDFFRVPNTSLKLNPKTFEKAELEKMLKDAIAAKILDHSVSDMHYGVEKKIPVNSVGQGIQRLIIAAIIQEIGKMKLAGRDFVILFEEPEIYLHPKLKERLHSALIELSERPGIKVVVTTHDPYFIQLAKDKKIYHVRRDGDGSTYIEGFPGKALPESWRSFNEINYLIFGVNGEDYLNELYGFIESKAGNSWTAVEKELSKKEAPDKKRKHLGKQTMTMTSYIRHEIHHRTKECEYTPEDVVVGINNLRSIITEKEYSK